MTQIAAKRANYVQYLPTKRVDVCRQNIYSRNRIVQSSNKISQKIQHKNSATAT